MTDSTCMFMNCKGEHDPLGVSAFKRRQDKGYSQEMKSLESMVSKQKHKSFNMGNSKNTEDVQEACHYFMERDYPDVDKPGIVFAPPIFFSKCPEVIDLEEKNWLPRQKEKLSRKENQIRGERAEHFLYFKLQQSLDQVRDKDDSIVVFHSYPMRKPEPGEADFLIVSKLRRQIVCIEVKNKAKGHKLTSQVAKIQAYFEANFGPLLCQSGWAFVKNAFFFSTLQEHNHVCQSCLPFVLKLQSDKGAGTQGNVEEQIRWWWNYLGTNDHPRNHAGEEKAFPKLIKYMLFLKHANLQPVTKVAVMDKLHSDITSTVGAANNIFFWTREQTTAMNDTRRLAKKMILFGSYGYGKTLMLKEKAKEVARGVEPGGTEEVYFVITDRLLPNNPKKTILQELMTAELAEHNVIVKSYKDLCDEFQGGSHFPLLEFTRRKPKAHLFIDEFEFGKLSQWVFDHLRKGLLEEAAEEGHLKKDAEKGQAAVINML